MATADQYGVDLDCLSGHGLSWGLASGSRNVANAIGRRLITPRGGLFYDPDYGFDTREYLGVALTRGKLAELIQGVESEALKDVRVQAVVASVSVTGNPSTSLTLELSVTLADGPVFDMIMSIADLVPGAPTVSLTIDGEVVPQSGLVSAPDMATPPPPFTPLALGSTLKLWLRGDLGVTQSGGLASAWADQSGNGNGCAEAVNKPSVITGLNGLPALGFTTSQLLSGAVAAVPAGSPRTIFIVMRNGAGTTGGPFFFKTAAPLFEIMWINTGGGRTYIYTDAVSSGQSVPLVANYDIACNLRIGWDGNTAHQVTCAINGVSQTVNEELGAMNSDTGTGGYRVGNPFDGEISEIVVCDTVLSAPNETLVNSYFSARYGI